MFTVRRQIVWRSGRKRSPNGLRAQPTWTPWNVKTVSAFSTFIISAWYDMEVAESTFRLFAIRNVVRSLIANNQTELYSKWRTQRNRADFLLSVSALFDIFLPTCRCSRHKTPDVIYLTKIVPNVAAQCPASQPNPVPFHTRTCARYRSARVLFCILLGWLMLMLMSFC